MTEVRTARVGSSPVRVVPVFAGPPGTTMTWRGAWDSAATYAKLDVARYNGSSYICTSPVGPTATTPDADGAHWEVLARAGIDGTGTVNSVAGVAPVAGDVPLTAGDIDALPVTYAPAWDDVTSKPAAIAAGADAAAARAAIGAGTSNLALGTTASTAAPGNDSRFAGVGIIDKSAAYALAATDAGAVIRSTAATAITITVPASLFTTGQIVEVLQYGAGQVTLAAGSGVTLRLAAAGLKTKAQYSSLSILFLSATEAVVSGDGAA